MVKQNLKTSISLILPLLIIIIPSLVFLNRSSSFHSPAAHPPTTRAPSDHPLFNRQLLLFSPLVGCTLRLWELRLLAEFVAEVVGVEDVGTEVNQKLLVIKSLALRLRAKMLEALRMLALRF